MEKFYYTFWRGQDTAVCSGEAIFAKSDFFDDNKLIKLGCLPKSRNKSRQPICLQTEVILHTQRALTYFLNGPIPASFCLFSSFSRDTIKI